jgi:hypothetical protein
MVMVSVGVDVLLGSRVGVEVDEDVAVEVGVGVIGKIEGMMTGGVSKA